LIAVTADRSVGIDVEHVRVDFDFQPIVDRYFSAREKSELLGKPQSIHPQHFFNMWTRKEAILKMLGQGLSLLDQLAGTAEDGSLNSVGKGWTLYPVDVGAEYEAALAVAGDRVQVIQQ
ncbi:MAG TPA: 4'-phosphopantetheinyl transferase superfamily protein, partial [Anaerolineae bacterium]|nr:4'-phosphopantetheinyl transferase superfamily protein [Anaerolineae bacterium]